MFSTMVRRSFLPSPLKSPENAGSNAPPPVGIWVALTKPSVVTDASWALALVIWALVLERPGLLVLANAGFLDSLAARACACAFVCLVT